MHKRADGIVLVRSVAPQLFWSEAERIAKCEFAREIAAVLAADVLNWIAYVWVESRDVAASVFDASKKTTGEP